jgi:hypothetical protein
MGGVKEELRKNRVFRNGCFYHPDKPNMVVALSPYGLMNQRYSTSNNHEAIVRINK